MSKLIEYAVKDRIGYITMNREEKRNALNEEMVNLLSNCFHQATNDPHCKIIVLRANGKVFSAGADLQYLEKLQSNTFEENLEDSTNLMNLFKQIYTAPKVVIAQIEGHAIAGGSGLATVCDFSYAVPEAKFGYTEVKIGFIPAIVKVFLLRKIGEGKAKELLLSGKLIEAIRAKEMGLINEVVTADKIGQFVHDFAKDLCSNASANSLKVTKQMISEVQHMSLDEGLKYAAEMNAQTRASDDCKKGISSFLNKEKINW